MFIFLFIDWGFFVVVAGQFECVCVLVFGACAIQSDAGGQYCRARTKVWLLMLNTLLRAFCAMIDFVYCNAYCWENWWKWKFLRCVFLIILLQMKLFGYELLIHHGVSFSFSILNFVSFLTNDQTKAENYIKVGIKLDWDNMKAILLCLLWCIWRERNAHCFEGKELPLMKLKFLFLKMLYEWMSAFISFSIQIDRKNVV